MVCKRIGFSQDSEVVAFNIDKERQLQILKSFVKSYKNYISAVMKKYLQEIY